MWHFEKSHLPTLKNYKRETLLNWLSWNDRNGIFTDKQSKAEGMPPMTKKEAIETITRIINEN
jgi:hypothetical protein